MPATNPPKLVSSSSSSICLTMTSSPEGPGDSNNEEQELGFRQRDYGDAERSTAWLGMSDSNSEMSSQVIALKGRKDLQESSRILATETFSAFRCGIGDTQLRAGAQPIHRSRIRAVAMAVGR